MGTIAAGPLAGGQLSYVLIDVHDLEAVLAFYRDRLGLTVVHEEPEASAFLELGGGPRLGLIAGREGTPSASTGDVIVVIDIDDLDGSAGALAARGVDVGPFYAVPGGRCVIFTDPEGNRVEIHQATAARSC